MSRLRLPLSLLTALAAPAAALIAFTFGSLLLADTERVPAQWPQYRADAARSGCVDDDFDSELALHWIYRPRQAPVPAWWGEDTRMHFDQFHHPVVVSGGMLYYSSSAECRVVALDAATGEKRWSYFTDAPVRFAPAFWEDRLFAVSDDGHLHVLEARTGRLLHRIHPGPRRDMVLGNRRMISRWPARGGPVIRDGIVYFGAGIWPSEGIYLWAVDAATCEILWRDDQSGAMEWDQPHGGARAESGISAQGYLAATEEHLLVPTGRGVPAVFDRQDGTLKYFHLQRYGKPVGGSTIVATSDFFFNGGHFFAEATGMSAGRVSGRDLMVATPRAVICSDGRQLQALGWADKTAWDRRGQEATVREPVPMSLGGSGDDRSLAGAVGGAVRLDGAGDHVRLDAAWADQPDTFAAWLKASPEIPDSRRVGIVAGNYPDADCINWEIHTRGRPRIYWKRGQVDWTVDADVRTGKWTHYAFVRDAGRGQISFYLDGSLVATHDQAGDAIAPGSPSFLGGDKRGSNAPWFDGSIDDVRVYNRPLSAEEIATLARARQPDGAPAEGLIFHLPLDERPATAGVRLRDASASGNHGRLASQSLAGVQTPHEVIGMIAVGDTIVIGGPDVVSALNLREQGGTNVSWQARIDGSAAGLAWAAGRLYVSSDRGAIYCYGPADGRVPRTVAPETLAEPWHDNGEFAEAAEEILRRSNVVDGYALDLASGEGRLAYELARRTNLHILAIESDPEKVALARERLTAAGLYGTRVTVHQGDPAARIYPNYFADLVVSSLSLAEGPGVVPAEEMMRVLRPWGGTAIIGKRSAMHQVERGALAGAGSWTHQYCDAANTLTSTDKLVQRPLGMLWFTDFEHLRMPDRHGRGPAPLFAEGRLFVLGMHGLYAIDAYNGRLLWDYAIEDILAPYDQEHILGTAVTGSGYCYGQANVYVRNEDHALQIDAATGKLLARFTTPRRRGDTPRTWGYLATEQDVLFGSTANDAHVTMWAWREGDMKGMPGESDSLFALDTVSGEHLWTYEAADSIRHNAIAIGDGTIYLIDRPIARDDLLDRQQRREPGSPALILAGEPAGHPFGTLLALDARTGAPRWKTEQEIFGTMLALSVEHDVLVMTYQHNHTYRLRSEIGGRMAGYQASTGKLLWDVNAAHQSRIMLNGSTIYAQAGAWNLLTGEQIPFRFTRSYGCGTLAGCENLLVFRSATLGYRDLSTDRTENYGGIRPGCWINVIPAGGLVLMPDATHGCTCSYLNKAHIALQPMPGEAKP